MATSKHHHPQSRNYQDISVTTGKSEWDTSRRLILNPATHMGIMDEVLFLLGTTTFDSMQTEVINNEETISCYNAGSLVQQFKVTYTDASWSLQIISI